MTSNSRALAQKDSRAMGTGRVKDKMDEIYGIEGIARFKTKDTVKILTAKGIVGRRSSQIPEMQNTGQRQLLRFEN